MNKEKLVFVATLLLCGLFVVLGEKVVEKKKRMVVRSAPLEVVEQNPKALEFLSAEASVWDVTSRDIFAEPRDIQDLPPLEVTYPEPVTLDLVKILPIPGPKPRLWSRLRVPFSAPSDSGDEEELEDEESSSDEVVTSDEGAVVGSLPAPGSGSAAEVARRPEELYDRVIKDGRALFGRIRNPDPRSLIDSEVDGVPNQYFPVAGTEIDFVQINMRTGRPIGAARFKRDQIDSFSFAETTENLYAARARLLSPGDLLGRIDLGRWAFEQGAYDLAEQTYDQAMTMAPERADVREALGQVYRRGFRWEEELAVYLDAIADQVESGEILTRLAEIYEVFGLKDDAEATLRSCTERFPGFLEASFRLGRLLLNSGRGDEAIKVLRAAEKGAGRESTEAHVEALVELAAGLVQEGRFSEADREVSRALDLQAGHRPGIQLLGVIRYLSGDAGSALEVLRSAREAPQASDDRLAVDGTEDRFAELYNFAIAALSADGGDEARRALVEAAAADPVRSGRAHEAAAFLSVGESRWESAYESLQAARKIDPQSVYGSYLLGKFHSLRGNHEAATALFRETLLRAPDFNWAQAELGRSSYYLEDWDSGVRFVRAALRSSPNSPELHVLAALHLSRMNRGIEAKDHVERALQIDGDYAPALNLKAVLLYESGDAEEVLRSLDYFRRAHASATKRGDEETAEYAETYRTAIEENRSKVQWTDDFNRKQIKRGWVVAERYGIRVSPQGNRIQLRGTQNQGDKITSLLREFSHRKLVSFQIDLEVPATQKVKCGVAVVRTQRDEVRDGLFFGKDGDGRLYYRVQKPRGSDEPVVISTRWPSDGKATLGIELAQPKDGIYNLLMNGEVVGEAKVASLKSASSVFLGVYGIAGIGSRWQASCDDAIVILRKD